MTSTSRFTLCMKAGQALLLAVAVCFSVGATDAGARYDNLSHRMMCTCGCAQLLGECNHVGCTESTRENAELRAGIAAGQSDKVILASFAERYGVTVLAAPRTHGFDLVAWIAPFAVFAAALLGTILVVRQWSAGRVKAPVPLKDSHMEELREKIRRETSPEGEGDN